MKLGNTCNVTFLCISTLKIVKDGIKQRKNSLQSFPVFSKVIYCMINVCLNVLRLGWWRITSWVRKCIIFLYAPHFRIIASDRSFTWQSFAFFNALLTVPVKKKIPYFLWSGFVPVWKQNALSDSSLFKYLRHLEFLRLIWCYRWSVDILIRFFK